MRHAIYFVFAAATVVSVLAEDAGNAPMPEMGTKLSLTLMAGPVGEADPFEVCAVDADALAKTGWKQYPGSAGLKPLQAPAPAGSVTLIAPGTTAAVRGYYTAGNPELDDFTTEMRGQFQAAFIAMAEQHGEKAEAQEIAKMMQSVDIIYLGNPKTRSMLEILGTKEGKYVVIVATPPEERTATPTDKPDPTEGKIPFEPSDPVLRMETTKGTMFIELYPSLAPITVENYLKLVDGKYYDNLAFHRIMDGFMIQGGDDGKGGPGWMINLEISAIKHSRGTLSMARTTDPNSANAQFFIVHKTEGALHLNGQYAAFGRVIAGLEVIDEIVKAAGGESFPPKDRCERILKLERASWDDVPKAAEAAGR
jgi:peptidyl-prolyl cis-trans isomerase B (cyclophilin B)